MTIHDESYVAFCGMYCEDCWIKKEGVSDLAVEMLQKIKSDEFKQLTNGLPKMMPILKGLAHYGQFVGALEAACFLACKKNCREGGGFPNCEIRKCCRQKAIKGCWECEEYKECAKLAWLEPAHPGAVMKNIENIRRSGIEAYLRGKKYF